MFVVSQIPLEKISGRWEENTMCNYDQHTFDNLEDARAWFDDIDPKKIVQGDLWGGRRVWNGFGISIQLSQEYEHDSGWIDCDILEDKQYTTDDAKAEELI